MAGKKKAEGLIYVVDMESSLSDSLARRVQDMDQYFIFRRWDMEVNAEAEVATYGPHIRGLIISGSSKNINSRKTPAPVVPAPLLTLEVPILAICYGMQYLAHLMEVPIIRCWGEPDPKKRVGKKAKSDPGEQGVVEFQRLAQVPIFEGLDERFPVWMKHNWMLGDLPPGWELLGRTKKCPIAGMWSGDCYALQFHPEPYGSLYGRVILHNFLTKVCRVSTPYF